VKGLHHLDPQAEAARVAEVQAYRQVREEQTTREALSALTAKARRPSDGENNLTAAILTAVKAQATVGEIADALRLVFGEYVG
jgi:methylmalonyl-CoA mutase